MTITKSAGEYVEDVRGRVAGGRTSLHPLSLIAEGLGFVGLGAAAMYVLDPTYGARRRGVGRDKFVSVLSEVGDCIDCTFRDMYNRAAGLAAEARYLFGGGGAPDEVIVERVRARMGRVVSHPKAVQVVARDAVVTLSGQILSDEADALVRAAGSVRGVKRVEDLLERHSSAENVPALQGGSRRGAGRIDVMQENWSPATRTLVGTLGFAMAAAGLTYAARQRSAACTAGGLLSAGIGAGFLLRATTNLSAKRLTGIAAGRRAVDIRKTININAPVDFVFAFFANYDNFPLWMHNVRGVRDGGDGTSHWLVLGPAGMTAEWDAVLTDYDVNKCIAWESLEGAAVANAGIIRFEEDPMNPQCTRVDIRLSYNPPGGALGHAAAALFGADPKSEMDEDLARLKVTIETGSVARDTAAREEGVRM